MGLIRDSFVIFKNWTDSLNELPEEYQLEGYKALMGFAQTGVIPAGVSAVIKAILTSFSFSMEKTIIKYAASVENGKKGGRPPKNTNPNEPSHNLEKPSETQANPNEPSHNLNVNVNDNVNDNEKYIYSHTNAHAHTKEYFEQVKELCEQHCPVIYNRHMQKPTADYNLGQIIGEVQERRTLSDIESVFKHASKTYFVKPKMQSCDLCWVLNNFEKVKNTPIEDDSGGNANKSTEKKQSKFSPEMIERINKGVTVL